LTNTINKEIAMVIEDDVDKFIKGFELGHEAGELLIDALKLYGEAKDTAAYLNYERFAFDFMTEVGYRVYKRPNLPMLIAMRDALQEVDSNLVELLYEQTGLEKPEFKPDEIKAIIEKNEKIK
jgi:hypothetical protein